MGAALGKKSTINSYVKGKVQQWVNEVEELATVERTCPQAAYAAFTHGMDIPYENCRSHTTVATAT